MVCRSCGGTAFDVAGTCLSCGAKSRTPHITQPRVSAVALATPAPLPDTTPRPHRRTSQPIAERDPAATNPGSGIFCGRCGSTVDTQSDFCGICGNPLKDVARQRLRQSRGLGAKSPGQGAVALAGISAADTHPAPRQITPSRPIFFILLGITAAIILSVALAVLVLHQH